MPASKNQIRRIQTIRKMMRQGRYPNHTSFLKEMRAQDPAGAYDISAKTFSRDIADLRDEYGAPVRYDSSRRGFYLTNPEWYNEDLMVEPFEMRAVLLGERAAGGIFPEPLRSEIGRAVGALLMKNGTGMAEGAELENFQVLCPGDPPRVAPEIFLAACSAWERRSLLKLSYRSARDHASEKLFEPHVFAWNGGSWYLKGKLLREDGQNFDPPKIRVLALHRIGKIEVLKSRFLADPAILKGVKESGLFDFEKFPEVVLEILAPFDRSFAADMADRITERGEGYLRIALKDIPKYEAERIALSAWGNVRVLAPGDLRESVCRIAEKLLENNRKREEDK